MQAPSNYKFRNSDAAKRLSDAIRLHQSVLGKDEILAGRFLAVRLADGGTDGVAYPNRPAAIEANRNNPSRCFYPQVPLDHWSPQVCDVLLWYVRSAYDNGVREDPAHQLILPTRVEDLLRDVGR